MASGLDASIIQQGANAPQYEQQALGNVVGTVENIGQYKQETALNNQKLEMNAMALQQQEQNLSDNQILGNITRQLIEGGANTADPNFARTVAEKALQGGLSSSAYFRALKNANDIQNQQINTQIKQTSLATSTAKLPAEQKTATYNLFGPLLGELQGVTEGLKNGSMDISTATSMAQNAIDGTTKQAQAGLQQAQAANNPQMVAYWKRILGQEQKFKQNLFSGGKLNVDALNSQLPFLSNVVQSSAPTNQKWTIQKTVTTDPRSGQETTHFVRVNAASGQIAPVGDVAGGTGAAAATPPLPADVSVKDVETVAGALKNAGISVPGGISGKAVVTNTLPYMYATPRNPGESIQDYAKRVAQNAVAGKTGLVVNTTEGRVLANQKARVEKAADALTESGGLIDNLTSAVNRVGYSKLKKLGSWQKWGQDQLNDPDLRELQYWLQETRADLQQVFSRGGDNTEGGNARAEETLPDIITPEVISQLAPAIKQGIQINEQAINNRLSQISAQSSSGSQSSPGGTSRSSANAGAQGSGWGQATVVQ